MKYLFFDIEMFSISHKERPIICNFGYYITDPNFNIINQGDIWINPQVKKLINDDFYILNKLIKKDFEWFKQFKPFEQHYGTIKQLLTDQDTIVFGISTNSDYVALCKDCKKINKPDINYKHHDLQLIFNALSGNYTKRHVKSLNDLATFFEINFDEAKCHGALYDAYLTMEVAKAMANAHHIKLHQYIKDEQYNTWINEKNTLDKKRQRIKSIEDRYMKQSSTSDLLSLIGKLNH